MCGSALIRFANSFCAIILISIKLSKMNLSGSDLSMVEIKFITEYPLFTFDFVGGVSNDALKIMLMY